MENKRLILFFILTTAVLLIYYKFIYKPVVPPPQPPQKQETKIQDRQPQPSAQQQSKPVDFNTLMVEEEKKSNNSEQLLPPVEQDLSAPNETSITIESSLYTAVFTNKGVGIKSFVLKNFFDDKKNPLDLINAKIFLPDVYPLYPFYFSPWGKNNNLFSDLNKQFFHYEGEKKYLLNTKEKKVLVFEYANKEKNISAKKSITFFPDTYVISIQNSVVSNGKTIEDIPVIFGPDLENNISKERTMLQNLKIGVYNGNDIKSTEFIRLKTLPDQNRPEIEKNQGSMGIGFVWAAYETTYFASIFKTEFKSEISYMLFQQKIANSSERFNYVIVNNPSLIYLGPKNERILAAIEKSFPGTNKVVEYGWFGAIAKILLKGLTAIYQVIPNYGWAIIILTLLLKLILFPLTYSSSISMAKMQTLQPKVKAIRKKYKNMRDSDQRRQMNVEIMGLYKEEKVNPAGGCLPMLLQLPILFGFWRMLAVSINVRHEPWLLWITDLSKKDPIYLLPILMAITQIVIQRMTPSGGDDTQRKMMYIMPVIMLILFINMPSGLNLYWTFSNVLQIGQQKIINDKIFKKKKEEVKERKILRRKK